MSERIWTTPPHFKNVNEAEVLNWIQRALSDKENEYQFIVGTDSQGHGEQFLFVTVICIRKMGKGGDFYLHRQWEPRANYVFSGKGKKIKANMKLRMFREVEHSVTIATELMDQTGIIPVIHIDASDAKRPHFTSEFSDELTGYVIANGFEPVLKPDSFVANAVADRYTK